MRTASRLIGLAALAVLAAAALPSVARAQKHSCAWCHDLHGGSYAALGSFATSQALCESCHGETGPATVLRDGVAVTVPKNVVIHSGAKHSTPTSCWNCHDHEGESTGNLKMIPTSRTGAALGVTRTVVFTALTGSKSYADGDATYDGVCEVCHTATTQHKYDGSTGKHNAAANCSTCHKHSGGFAGAGGRCTGCHNQTQSERRIITTEFSRLSHHVTGYAVPDSIPDADCQVCHDQSQHQQGSVRLWNVDAPGNTAQAIVLTGDPNTVNAEAAKLESFCKKCHDANGANGDLTPFSDNVTRPLVDTTTWNASSHSTSANVPAGCYKDCHASGHGSQKRKMLAPAGTLATSPTLTEEQEGFCFTCHKSGGAAPTGDFLGLFSRTINWVSEAAGLNNNPNLNDRHDIQQVAQARSGAKIECTNCHNPHVATHARPYILDPDPTAADNHVVGTNWYIAAYNTAKDTLSEFCLDCHDGTFPSGVLGHTSPAIVDIELYWRTVDVMGAIAAKATDLRTGTGWAKGDVMPCKACHVAHMEPDADASNTTNLFGVVDTVRNKTNTAYLPFNDGTNIFAYSLTNNLTGTPRANSGGMWCNTCHIRSSMYDKDNCYSCHRHGDGRF